MALELVFDFDGTITEADSIASVVDAALSHHKASSSPETFGSLTDAWHHIVRSYLADLDSYHGDLLDSTIQHRHSTFLQVAEAHFSNDQRRRIERASLLRVQDAGLFRGVPPEYLYRCGQEHTENGIVKLRNGFSEFIDLVLGPSMHSTRVLSVNWSATYIRGVLSGVGILPVFANETNPADGSITAVPAASADIAGAAWPRVLTVGSDKLSALRCLRRHQHEVNTHLRAEIVYFGDSTTDLECLLEFGGIVISPMAEIVQRPGTAAADANGKALGGGDLLHVLRTMLNYNVPHVSQYKGELICWARDFAEIVHSNFLQKRAANVRAKTGASDKGLTAVPEQ